MGEQEMLKLPDKVWHSLTSAKLHDRPFESEPLYASTSEFVRPSSALSQPSDPLPFAI